MPVTEHPLHKSARAQLPFTAPVLGCDDQTPVRVGVADVGSINASPTSLRMCTHDSGPP
jgi:hypothetical protein